MSKSEYQPNGRSAGRRIAVIGAGFSGTLTAIQLLERCEPADSVILFERRPAFARGVAYSADENHLLNVRAANMSAFPDDADHFLRWLAGRHPSSRSGGAQVSGDRFVPRTIYGEYLQELLRQAVARFGGRTLELANDEVLRVEQRGEGARLEVAGGRIYEADAAVLAVGAPPPAPTQGPYRSDPWAPGALSGIDPDRPVLILGTGLTMVDVTLALLRQGQRAPIHALSRRGLLPQRHASAVVPLPMSGDELLAKGPTTLRLMRTVRSRVEAAQTLGLDWHSVVDGLRPHTETLWRGLSLPERQRFLRHLRPWWEAHRHRMAPEVADAIETAQARGRLTVTAGRVLGMDVRDYGVGVVFHRKYGTATEERLEVGAVIDCTGLNSPQATADPLLRALIADGRAHIDTLGLGLAVDPETDALIDRQGRVSERLFAVGPLTRAAHWEMVAIPDLRRQCARLAAHILGGALPQAAEKPAPARTWLGFGGRKSA